MHNNYYFLKQLSAALHTRLEGYELAECFSQSKNELVLGFLYQNAEFYIKAHLDPSFCCLSFPGSFSRARKNSVNLFPDLVSQKVISIRQFVNERCFSIIFDNDFQLLFKMHGNRSNIILFHGNEITEVFKNNLKKDFELEIAQLDRPLDQSREAFINSGGDYQKLFPTFGKVVKRFLQQHGIASKDLSEQWQLISDTLEELSHPQYYITQLDGQLQLSLLETGTIQKKFSDPVEALDTYFIKYISETSLEQLKHTALASVERQLKQTESYINKAEAKLNEIESRLNYRILADILMANLHRVPPKASEVTLENFYENNTPVAIKLKPDLSPQKNAEVYYRKAKNQSVEVENLKTNIAQKLDTLFSLEEQKAAIENERDFRTLRGMVRKEESRQKPQHRPFNAFQYNGFDIWVGRNARSNDQMLQQFAFKDDLWLHAKDVSGSHVLIKYQAGKAYPKNVIEKAAELAAYNSKGKSDSLCPVIVTPRKYVRKRKGDPAGAVMVDKEESVVLVKPNNWSSTSEV